MGGKNIGGGGGEIYGGWGRGITRKKMEWELVRTRYQKRSILSVDYYLLGGRGDIKVQRQGVN